MKNELELDVVVKMASSRDHLDAVDVAVGASTRRVRELRQFRDGVRATQVWMQKWPSMCVLNGSQMYWTAETEQLIEEKGAQGPPAMLARQKEQLAAMVLLVRGDLPGAVRNQVGALAVIDVHARDVMIRLTKEKVSDISDFTWC